MKNKIKEKVLKEVVDKTIHLKSRNEIIPEVIDLTLASVGKVIDERIKEIEEDVRNWKQFVDYKTLKEKAHERIKELKELKQKLEIGVLK